MWRWAWWLIPAAWTLSNHDNSQKVKRTKCKERAQNKRAAKAEHLSHLESKWLFRREVLRDAFRKDQASSNAWPWNDQPKMPCLEWCSFPFFLLPFYQRSVTAKCLAENALRACMPECETGSLLDRRALQSKSQLSVINYLVHILNILKTYFICTSGFSKRCSEKSK